MKQLFSISSYLAVKEIWRNRGRFLLVSLVIALITLLVLFIAALGEGLGNGNREYISKLDGQLIVYQAKSDFLIQASRIDLDRLDEPPCRWMVLPTQPHWELPAQPWLFAGMRRNR